MEFDTDADGVPIAVTLSAREDAFSPELLLAAASAAASQLRVMYGISARAEWEEVTGRQLRTELRSAWHGRVTDLYLATLAKAYVEIAQQPFLKLIPTLAGILDRPANTIKMHVVRARDRGFLSAGEAGKAVGHLTDAARQALND